MAFLRVVEVLPPLFPNPVGRDEAVSVAEALKRFTQEVRAIRRYADLVLVANVKREDVLKIDAAQAALLLRREHGIDAAPVVVIRDLNRSQFLSTMLTIVATGLKSAMVAWGDDYRPDAKSSNVRDFPDLSAAIREASEIASRVNPDFLILAPVDVEDLSTVGGAKRARKRLAAGADLLLAQPPTTDDGETFERHLGLLRKRGVDRRTLLSVFHFKGTEDVKHYEDLFGWKLPRRVHEASSAGEEALTKLERRVIERIRSEGLPGVCLSTRGSPLIARPLLT